MAHYFETPEYDREDEPRVLALQAAGWELELRTGSGVFSRERLDVGTAYLLDVAPPPPAQGDLLDLGCGYGPIALTLAALSPAATVWAVDVNERARQLCAENAARAGLANVRVRPPEDVPATVRFAAIWSNPPIRIGKTALHEMLVLWLGRLTPTGEAYLVVQRHLGSDSLHRWLAAQGWPTDRVGSRNAYRVLRVHARRSA